MQESQRQPSGSVHTVSVAESGTRHADFPEAPLSVAALLARMQKLKSTNRGSGLTVLTLQKH